MSHPGHRSPTGLGGISQATHRHRNDVNANGLNHYTRRKQPSPGVQQYSYDNHRVIEQPIIGDAVAFQMQFQSYQPPQLYMQQPALLTTGLGGIVNGQIIFQPPRDPFA